MAFGKMTGTELQPLNFCVNKKKLEVQRPPQSKTPPLLHHCSHSFWNNKQKKAEKGGVVSQQSYFLLTILTQTVCNYQNVAVQDWLQISDILHNWALQRALQRCGHRKSAYSEKYLPFTSPTLQITIS